MSYYDYYQPEAYIPARIPILKRTAPSTMRSTACATRPRRRCRSGGMLSSWRRCPASTRWATPSTTAAWSSACAPACRWSAMCCASGWWTCNMSATTSNFYPQQVPCPRRHGGHLPGLYERSGHPGGDFFGDEIDRIVEFNPVTGAKQNVVKHVAIFPASHYIVSAAKKRRRHWRRSAPSATRRSNSSLPRASSSRPSASSSGRITTSRC